MLQSRSIVCVLATSIAATLVLMPSAEVDAQPSQYDRSSYRTSPLSVHPRGVYGGVQPGVAVDKVYKKRRPVLNRKRVSTKRPVVRWVGFQRNSGNSRLFVQLSAATEYSQRLEGTTLIVSMPNARLGGSNARRPLDTRFFETPVLRAVAKPFRKRRARGVDLHITFKDPKDASEASATVSTGDDGFSYLFLDVGQTRSGSTASADDDDNDDDDNDDDDDGGDE